MRKERFPKLRQNKLHPRADGPFKVLQKIGDNAYKIDLPNTYGVSNTFNIGDLKLYKGREELGTIQLEEGGNDATTKEPSPLEEENGPTPKGEHPTRELRAIEHSSDLEDRFGQLIVQGTLQDLRGADMGGKDKTNPRDAFLIHGPSHKGPRVTLTILTEPTRPTPRSGAHQN